MTREPLLSGAVEIADRLIHRSEASGFAPAWPAGPSDAHSPCVSLWRGTSGIALFLAELHAVTEEVRYRAAAERALGWCVEALDTLPHGMGTSFLGGGLGVAYALCRLAERTGERRALEQAREVVRRLVPPGHRFDRFDLFGGASGALVVLGELQRQGAASDLEPVLADVLAQVVRAASVHERGVSWPCPAGAREAPIGLSHGATGVAYGLLSALESGEDEDLRRLILGALRFDLERSRPQGAPEVAGDAVPGADAEDPRRDGSWCRGSAGLAIAQTRALHAGEASLEPVLADTVGATRRYLEETYLDPWASFTLCHGCGGPVDLLLLEAERRRPGEEPERLAVRVAGQALVQLREVGGLLPGTLPPDEEDPSLFVGSAGVGLMLARVADRRVRSVLSPAGTDGAGPAVPSAAASGSGAGPVSRSPAQEDASWSV